MMISYQELVRTFPKDYMLFSNDIIYLKRKGKPMLIIK